MSHAQHADLTSDSHLRNPCWRESFDAELPEPIKQRLAEIASGQMAEVSRIAQTMVESYEAEIPAYAAITDPVLREDVRWVSAALVRIWLTILSTGKPVTDEMLLPLCQGARRRVVQGIDLQSLLRAYRVGIRVMWRQLLATPAWAEPEMQGVLGRVAEWAMDYADALATEVASVYLAQAKDAARQREHRRSEFLSLVLAGPTKAEHGSHPELLERHVVVITEAAGEPGLPELEEIGAFLETSAGVALWTIRHRRVIGVLPLGAVADRRALRRSLESLLTTSQVEAIGIGCDASSPAETRDSYAEATAAVELGRILHTTGSCVFDYLDLGSLAALLEQPDRSQRLMSTALAPFEAVLNHSWGAETLDAYLSCQGHVKDMASHLGIHPSTVKYRLQIIRKSSGYACLDGDGGFSILLALRLRRLLRDDGYPPGLAILRGSASRSTSEVVPFPQPPASRRRSLRA